MMPEPNNETISVPKISNLKSEIVIGLVAPIGVDLKSFEILLNTVLSRYRYSLNIIKLSEFLASESGIKISREEIDNTSKFKRYESLMDAGNAIRSKISNSFLAEVAISKISVMRATAEPLRGKIHVLHSIKHKKEVEILREVYGNGFFLVGVYSNKAERIANLQRNNISEQEAIELLFRDNNDNEKYGQQVSKVFELSDVFIHLKQDNLNETSKELERFFNLIFGDPYVTPTKDENAMFLAYAASLRSGSLARQIGAVIANDDGDILATGTNDVPKYCGGQYWEEDKDKRDFQRGFDANTKQRNRILEELLEAIYSSKDLLIEQSKNEEKNEIKFKEYKPEELLAISKQIFKGTTLFDLTEFGRDVHAEMEALLSCVRNGISVKGKILYCTTFPCHNCAKHIVDAGIVRVVFVEAYPKSKAKELHSDSIAIEEQLNERVIFEPFVGIGARKYLDLFSLSLGTGLPKERKDDDGNKLEWIQNKSYPRIQMVATSYIEREEILANQVNKKIKENTTNEDGN
jgi:deoxycytidylate deaminase